MAVSPELGLAQQLIRVASTPESRNELRVAELLADRLEAAGFEVTVHTYGGHHGNVVARWGRADKPAVCLSGHLDTVSVVEEDWSYDPYGAEIVGPRLYGRGAADMKSGVAAIVRAAELYVASSPLDGMPIVLVLTAEEEVGSLGAAALTESESLPESRLLLIAEPTSNRPVLGHRGAVWLDLVARGRSCHASTPELGDNAVEKLVNSLRTLIEWNASHPTNHETLGARSMNIGRFDGGVLRNIVPDRAVAQIDFRTPSQHEQATLLDTLVALLKDQVTVESVLALPPVYTDPTDPMVRVVRDVARNHINLIDGPTVARFFTDASVLTPKLGMAPTLICGPGSSDQAHVVDEWCATEDVAIATAMYLDVLHTVAGISRFEPTATPKRPRDSGE